MIPGAKQEDLIVANGFPKKGSYINWHRSNGDMGSSRYSLLDEINVSNVKSLEPAWVYNFKGAASVVNATPAIANGILYTPASKQHIVALDAKTGLELWRFKSPEKNPARRGMIYWKGTKTHSPRIYFAAGKYLYALDAKTGNVVPDFGENSWLGAHVEFFKSSRLWRNEPRRGSRRQVPPRPTSRVL